MFNTYVYSEITMNCPKCKREMDKFGQNKDMLRPVMNYGYDYQICNVCALSRMTPQQIDEAITADRNRRREAE